MESEYYMRLAKQSHTILDLKHKSGIVDRIVELFIDEELVGFITPTSDPSETAKGKLDIVLKPGVGHFSFYCEGLAGIIINEEIFKKLNEYSHSADITRKEVVEPKPVQKIDPTIKEIEYIEPKLTLAPEEPECV
jgi:hypothetical protein